MSTSMLVFFSGFLAIITVGYRLLERTLGPSKAWLSRARFRLRSLFRPDVLAMESAIVSADVLGLRARLNCGTVPDALVAAGVMAALSWGVSWLTTLVRSGTDVFAVCGSSKSG